MEEKIASKCTSQVNKISSQIEAMQLNVTDFEKGNGLGLKLPQESSVMRPGHRKEMEYAKSKSLLEGN